MLLVFGATNCLWYLYVELSDQQVIVEFCVNLVLSFRIYKEASLTPEIVFDGTNAVERR